MTASSRDLLSLRTAAELAAIALLVLLTGCASQPPSPIDGMDAETAAAKSASRKEVAIPVATETVREGDTLYAIAFRRGLDFLDIAAWNGIKPPYTIFPGQRLRLGPANETATAAAAPATGLRSPRQKRQGQKRRRQPELPRLVQRQAPRPMMVCRHRPSVSYR
jgi:LysM repeat protein